MSVAEAVAAEHGGADRLELVRDLDQGGLSPSPELVKEVISNVDIPVRVMVREADSMQITDPVEQIRLKRSIDEFSAYPINGLVVGFLRGGRIDEEVLDDLLPPDVNVTFHRAFDEASDQVAAIAALKRRTQVDRILTRGGPGSWSTRKMQVEEWQSIARPEIQMLFAVGRDTSRLHELHQSDDRYEVHVGRAARISHVNSGAVSAEYVAALKNAFETHVAVRNQFS